MNKEDKVAKVMHEWKQGKLTSHGKVVKDYDQAIAIALSEAGLSKKYEGGGEISDLGFAYLADLWFAVQQRDTDDYEKLSKRLDEEGISYRIQNEVSADATELRGRKSLSISEVHDRIKKILSKKYETGGGVEENENALMVANNNKQIAHHTREMESALKDTNHVPAWVVAKVNRSASDLSDATHYLEGQGDKYEGGGDIGKFAYGQTEMLKAELKNNLRDLEMMNKVMLENDMFKRRKHYRKKIC